MLLTDSVKLEAKKDHIQPLEDIVEKSIEVKDSTQVLLDDKDIDSAAIIPTVSPSATILPLPRFHP